MDFFKLGDSKDHRDLPLDERDWPLDLQVQADFDLSNKFDLNDKDYTQLDNVSATIDQQAQDEREYQNEQDAANPDMGDDSEMDENLFGDQEQPPEEDALLGGEQEQQEEDPNLQGIIRTVQGANLVYKRQSPDNTYTELWLFNLGRDMKKESQTRRAILAGTDIDVNQSASTDGKQTMTSYSIGNIQYIELNGLPQ